MTMNDYGPFHPYAKDGRFYNIEFEIFDDKENIIAKEYWDIDKRGNKIIFTQLKNRENVKGEVKHDTKTKKGK